MALSNKYTDLKKEFGLYTYELEVMNDRKHKWLRIILVALAIVMIADVVYTFATSNGKLSVLNICIAVIVFALLYATMPETLFSRKIYQRYYDLMHQFYLEKVPVYQFIDLAVFQRMSFYLDHGLCYEAALLFMLMGRENKTSRFIVAKSHNRKGNFYQHSWVEFRAYGFWWVIDPTWEYLHTISPRLLHNLKQRPKYLRVVKYADFWEHELSQRFYKLLQKPETSRLFNDLAAFRCVNDKGDMRFLLEQIGEDYFAIHDGKKMHLSLVGVYGDDHPVTPRIIKQYLTKVTRRHPKAHNIRNGKALVRTVRRADADVKKLRAKDPDEEYRVVFDSFWEYTIEKIPPTHDPEPPFGSRESPAA